jgi:transposase
MRGSDDRQGSLFSFVDLEARIPQRHPLRRIKELVEAALIGLQRDFSRMYAAEGRPSIAPEKLLRAQLLQALFTVRSERQLMEQLDYNLMFRWFVGLGIDDRVWDPTTFTKNRDRLLEHDIARRFFEEVLSQARTAKLLSDEHFTVDGTFIEAWASQKSFRSKDDSGGPGGGRNDPAEFRGEKRSNDTHTSTTDPDARLMRKSNLDGARLVHHGHVLTENRHGLVVDATVTVAAAAASERQAAVEMVDRCGLRRATIGADRGYDNRAFIDQLRERGLTPHVAQNDVNRASAIDGRTTHHPGYRISQRRRKMVEEVFGWMKTVGMLRKTRHRGRQLVASIFVFTAAAYNLVRMRSLIAG